jgi:hypothetical protein
MQKNEREGKRENAAQEASPQKRQKEESGELLNYVYVNV